MKNTAYLKSVVLLVATSLVALMFVFLPFSAEAKTIKVKSYYKPTTGKFIQSHYKTSPNKTKLDNFSTKGNYNPYTGKKGTAKAFKF